MRFVPICGACLQARQYVARSRRVGFLCRLSRALCLSCGPNPGKEYGVRMGSRPRVKEQKSINMLPSPSVRTIIVERASSRHALQYIWRLQSSSVWLKFHAFRLPAFAGLSTSRWRRAGKVTEHSCSHATMSSNGAAALLTTPGHRGPPAMSAAAAAELVEARGAARDGHRIASHSSFRLLHGVHYQLCFDGKTMY